MSHHYVYSHYGHSNYFAGSKNSNYYHSSGTTINIFNFGTNRNCNSHSNGGFWNGFWGGIGMSLGNMFAPMLGVSWGNIMGGFNFTNPFSTQLWGGSPSAGDYSSLLGGNNTAVTPLSKNKLEDADYAKLNALEDEADKLMKNGTEAEIEALKKKVKAYGDKNGDTDNINKADNKAQKERILGKLVQVPKKETAPAPAVQPKENNAEDEGTITINGKPVKITDATPEQIKALGFDGLEKLPNKDKATAIGTLSADDAKNVLNKAGIKPDDYGNYKMSTNYTTLLLLQKAQVNVNVATNTKNETEPMIRGRISDVEIDDKGEITFLVDNSTIKNDMGLVYEFKGKENTFKLTYIKNLSPSDKFIINGWKDREFKFETTTNLLTIADDNALASKNPSDGRFKLEKDKDTNSLQET